MKKSSGTLVCPWPECIFRSLLQFLVYYLDCTKCKFPDFSLTFPNIHFFPWPSTKFPDFCQVWNFPDFSLTAGHPVHGIYWYSIEYTDILRNILIFHGIYWYSMEYTDILWNIMYVCQLTISIRVLLTSLWYMMTSNTIITGVAHVIWYKWLSCEAPNENTWFHYVIMKEINTKYNVIWHCMKLWYLNCF